MKTGKSNHKLLFTSFFVSLFLFSCVALGVALYRIESKNQISRIVFLDVGQGDAIFIEAPNGVQVLIDAGPDGAVVTSISEVMRFWDRTIDVVLPTHADKDHIGGFPDIFRRFEVAHVYDTSNTATTAIYEEYARLRDMETRSVLGAWSGDIIALDRQSGVYLRVLFPDQDVSGLDRNDASTVVQFVHGDIEVLLTGDASTDVEEYLVHMYGDGLRSEILKAGHHGSDTSTSNLFLDTVQPEAVVVSAGLDNRYGHPHPDVVARIQNRSIALYETARMGTIFFETDGKYIWNK